MPASLDRYVTVTDETPMVKYASLLAPLSRRMAASFLARWLAFVQLEGQRAPANVVAVLRSVEDAVDCYNSDAYQEALEPCQRCSDAN